MNDAHDTLSVTYQLEFENGQTQSYTVSINKETMDLIPHKREPSAWTKLENKKCGHCPLKVEDSPNCPVATSLDHLVDYFKESKSMWKTKVTVITEERDYVKDTDLQTALFSIFGLIMATSRCPYMNFLKPMARFHLPFSTMDETTTRATSFYLLKQYFVAKEGGNPDHELKELETAYMNLNKVNWGIIERIRGLGSGDSQSNAITILDCFAQTLSMEISSDLAGIRPFF